jgi:stringent starvation protein B
MISNKPYLLRAFHQWIVDSACTPILVIDAKHPRCKIPQDYAEEGEIVFNISPIAVRDLKITNESIEFKASFSGVIHIISAPITSILSIYAEENGEGLFFDPEEGNGEDSEDGEERSGAGNDSSSSIIRLREVEDTGSSVSSGPIKKSKPILKLVE